MMIVIRHRSPPRTVSRLPSVLLAGVLALLGCGLAACQGPTATPVRPVTIVETEGEHPHAQVTMPPDPTDPAPQVFTATPRASQTPRPTRTPTRTPDPDVTPTWTNSAEALESIELPSDWIPSVDLTGAVTVTHPVGWTVSEQGMNELSFMPPRQAWAKVRLVNEPVGVVIGGEGLDALAEEVRAIEARRNEVLQVQQSLYADPLLAASVSLYSRDPQRRYLLCQVVHVWLPLEDGRHVYGIIGRYDRVVPAITADELDQLWRMMVSTARASLLASP